MTVVSLSADERLIAAFNRYNAAWALKADDDEVVIARLEVCEALLAVGETLAPELLEQMAADRATLAQRVPLTA